MKAAAAPAPGTFLTSTDKTADPLYMSATKIAEMIRTKKITAFDVVKLCYKRIDEVNPKINAVVMFCRERALAERKRPTSRSRKENSSGRSTAFPLR